MQTARLYIDGTMTLWALVQCDACSDVYKYLALDAARSPVPCTSCTHVMDVRQPLRDAAAEWSKGDDPRADVTRNLLRQLPPMDSPTASMGI